MNCSSDDTDALRSSDDRDIVCSSDDTNALRSSDDRTYHVNVMTQIHCVALMTET